GHGDGRAQRGLGERDGDVAVQVVVAALEELVLAHLDDDVEIARRTAVDSRVALARDAQPRAVVHAGRDLDLQRLFGENAPLAAAGLAWVLDHLARAAAMAARPR